MTQPSTRRLLSEQMAQDMIDTAIGAATGTAPATTTTSGIVQLATSAETLAGTDTSKVTTPADIAAVAATKANTIHTHATTDITSGTLGLARGGTGATDAASARTALGAAATSHTHAAADVLGGTSGQVLTSDGTKGVWADSTGGGGGTISAATTTTQGIVYLATNTEAVAGTDTSKAMTPAATAAAVGAKTYDASAITSGTFPISRGGTGQTTQQAALNALVGTQTSGRYLRSDGTNTALTAIVASDVPTLNQNTTGTASNVTGTVAIGNGGTSTTSLPSGLLKGAGTSAITAAIAGTDFAAASHTHTPSQVTSLGRIYGTSAQRTGNSIMSPINGLEFYETDTQYVYVYQGSSWSLWSTPWVTFTPSYTNVTLGTPTTNTGQWCVTGGQHLFIQANFVLGTGSGVTGTPVVTVPNGMTMKGNGFRSNIGNTIMYDGTNAEVYGPVNYASATTFSLRYYGIKGTPAANSPIAVLGPTTTGPFTWASGAQFNFEVSCLLA